MLCSVPPYQGHNSDYKDDDGRKNDFQCNDMYVPFVLCGRKI